MIDIIIPTNKELKKLKKQISNIESTVNGDYKVLPTCFKASAATNRNYGLNQAKSEIVIMLDDDIKGFFHNWANLLIESLQDPDVVMVSARLMHNENKAGLMMNIKPDLSKDVVEVKDRMLPSACIAFRNDGTRFDEAYIGAGYEDTDFCMQLNEKYPNGKYMIDNRVKLIHKNEMKNQLNGQLMRNKYYFFDKWNVRE